MAIQRFSSSDSTKIWEHLNRVADDVDAEFLRRPLAASGTENFPAAAASAGETVATVTITFPVGLFTGVPAVTAGPQGTNINLRRWITTVTSVTSEGATVILTSTASTGAFSSVPLAWQAIGD